MTFLDFRILDLLDILLVAFLLFQLYRLVRGTVAINIFIGVATIFLIWKLVEALGMELLSEILGKFIGVGVIALVIVFQQEIRKFLVVLGSTSFMNRNSILKKLNWAKEPTNVINIDQIIYAIQDLSSTRTGALMVIEKKTQLGSYIQTGTALNAELSQGILLSIFNKYSPLHDGAAIISGNTIKAAACILPVTDSHKVPSRFGLRHRAAIGMAEKTDAIIVVVSEETGEISLLQNEEFKNQLRPIELQELLEKALLG